MIGTEGNEKMNKTIHSDSLFEDIHIKTIAKQFDRGYNKGFVQKSHCNTEKGVIHLVCLRENFHQR